MPDFDKNLSPIIRESSPEQFVPTVGPVRTSPLNVPASSTPDLSRTLSVLDEIAALGAKAQSGTMRPFVTNAELQANKRYPTYNPTIKDQEDFFAYGQSGVEQAINGVLKGTNLAATTIAGGFAALGGLIASPFTGKLSTIWDNPVMNALDKWNDYVDQEVLPNYYTQTERDAKWYSTDNWMTSNFLFDKLIKNAGFAVGAMYSGNIANSALLRAGAGIGKALSRGAAVAEASESFKLFTPLLRNTARAFSSGENKAATALLEKGVSSIADVQAKASKLGEIAKSFNQFADFGESARRTAIAAYSSMGEASFEALQTSKEFRNKLIEDYKKNNGGLEPDANALEDINMKANDVGRASFLGNLAILSVTEFKQLPKLLGSSYNASRQAANSLLGEVNDVIRRGGIYEAVAPTTKFGKVFDKVTGVGKYVFDPKEMAQEGLQYSLQVGSQNYYNKAFRTNDADLLVDGLLYGLVGKDEKGEGKGLFVSKEGMESLVLGGLTGGLMQVKGTYTESKAKAQNTQAFLQQLNNSPDFAKSFQDRMNSINRSVILQQQEQAAILSGDKLEAKDLETDQMHNYLATRIKYGRFDMVKEDIAELRRMSSTAEGLAQLKEQGIGNINDDIPSFQARLANFERVADYTNELYRAANLRFAGQTNEEGQRKYSDEIIDKMVYAASKIADYDLRIPQVNSQLSMYGIVTEDVLNKLLKEGKTNKTATKEALKQINSIEDQIDDLDQPLAIKNDLKTALSDVMEMASRRKLYMSEYDEMVTNPEDYEVPDEEIEAQFAKVKQLETTEEGKKKTVTKDLEVGKEYSLAEPLTRNGNELLVAPKIKILSKTLGGEFEVQLPTGDITFFKPEDFKKYNVIEDDNGSQEINQIVKDAALEGIKKFYPELDTTDQDPLEVLNNLNDQELSDYVESKVKAKMQEYQETLAKIAKEAEELAENQKLESELQQTYSSDIQILDDEEKAPSEADSRKSDMHIVTGTISSPNIPGYENSNALGFNLNNLPNRNKLVGVYITSKNENLLIPGLTKHLKDAGDPEFTKDINPDETIVMVVAQKNKNGYTLVGKDGQPLGPGANPLTDAVYQVKPNAGLEWSKEYTPGQGKSMFRDAKQREAIVKNYVEQYDAERKRILSLTTLEDHSFDASFGVGIPVPTLDSAGKQIKGVIGKNSVANAGIVSDEDLASGEPVIVIPTTDDKLVGGTTSFNNPKGKVFAKVGNNYVKLDNNKITSKQANVIYEVMRRFAENARRDKSLTKSDSPKLTSFLKSVLYWGTPQEGGSPGRNSAWIQGGKLNIGRDGFSVAFTPSSIEKNKDRILEELGKMFHNVNSTMAKDVSTIYSEITGIDQNGKLSEKKWPNYQSYLMSSKGREVDNLPLTVNLASGINRKGIYFITTDEIDKFAAPVAPVKPAVITPAPVAKGSTPQITKSEQVLDGKTINSMTIEGRGTITYTVDGIKLQSKDLKGIIIPQTDENKQFVTRFAEEKGTTIEQVIPSIKAAIANNIADEVEAYTIPAPAGMFKKTGAAPAPAKTENIEAKKADIEKRRQAELDKNQEEWNKRNLSKIESGEGSIFNAESYEEAQEWEEFGTPWDNDKKRINAKYDKELEALTGKPVETPKTKEEVIKEDNQVEYGITDDDELMMDIQLDDIEDDEVLRAIVDQNAKRFQREDWTKAEAFLKKSLPNVPVYRVKNVITATNGMQAWGMLKDGAIYLYNNAEVGTVYHEVFEAVWKMFTTPEERAAILAEFRSRPGEFVDRPTGQTIKYSEATAAQAKEQLAEEFRDYKLNPKKEEGSKIVGFFKDLLNFIKEFFVGPSAESNTKALFDKIDKGYYKSYAPYHSSLSFAKEGIIDIEDAYATDDAEFSIANFTGAEQHDLIQQMLYLTLREMVKTNESLFKVESNLNKTEFLDNLKDQLQKTVLKSKKEALKSIKEETLTEEEAQPIIVKSNAMWKAIQNEENWNNITKKFEEKLKTYNIEFDETEQLVKTDEDNNGREYQEANKINEFKKANPAIKLLLSTLPIMEYDNAAKKNVPVRSSINGVKLIPTSQAFMAVLNKVSSSRTLDEMMEKLREMANQDPNYQVLYTRLTKNKDLDQPADISKLNDIHDIQLVNAFWRSFKKANPIVKNVFTLENGEVVVGDSNFTAAANQVREEFTNQIRKVVQAPNNGYFVYDKSIRAYRGIKKSVTAVKFNQDTEVEQLRAMTAFLKEFGILFDVSDILSDKLSSQDRSAFKDAVQNFRDSMYKSRAIFSINGKTLDISGRLRQLAEIKAKLDNPEFSSTYFNVKGERTQTFIGTNAATDLYDMLSQVDNINQLRGTQYEYLLTDSFAKNSYVLKRMFNEVTGKKNANFNNLFKVGYADGIVDSVSGKKKQSSKLTYKERISQELNLNLAGYYLNLVPGDSSLEWMFYLGNPITFENIQANGLEQVFDIFKGYFIDEMNLAREERPVAKGRVSGEMRFFKAILGDTLHDSLMSEEGTPEEIYEREENKTKINEAVKNFIAKTAASFNSTLMEYDVITKKEQTNTYDVNGISLALTKNVTENEMMNQMMAINASYIINNIEMHKLLYSDPYQYSDELKRIKNFNSPRQSVIHSSDSINTAMNRVWNRGYAKDDIGRTDFRKDYFRTINIKDVEVRGSLKDYGVFEETDGGGIILDKANRNFKIRAGEWTDDNERQYKYDIAWYKNHKDLPLTQEEDEILTKGNPGIKSTYTPIKPIVSGNKKNGKKYNDVMLDKFALYPLSYRVIFETNPTANALKLYDKMLNENIDYGVFNSGRKVGKATSFELYKDGAFNNSPIEDDIITNVPFAIMSIQSEVPSKDEALITRGSQMTKLVTMDFMEAGVPVTFMKGQPFAERYKAWYSEDNDKMRDSLYKEIKDNQEYLELIMANGFNELLDKLGIKKVEGGYQIENVQLVSDTLKAEILKREVNDNVSSALEGYANGDVVLEATPAYQQIRNILYSIADKNVISPKIRGGMKVQIPSTLLESNRITNEDGKFTSTDLKFYEDSEGNRHCEIMLARWFESDKTDKELMEYFNNTPEGKKQLAALAGVAFRIPTQKQNSIESFRIAKFLPKEFGDSVVVPSELVKKAGSDFDIDKLNIYLKNVYSDRNGDIKLFEYKGSEEATKQFYSEVFDQLNQSKEAYIRRQLANLSAEEEIDYEAEEELIAKQEKLAINRERFVKNAYKYALENAYMQSTQNLIEHEENFERLVQPNSAEKLKTLAERVSEKLRSEKFDYANVGNLINRRFMSRLRHAFVTGKYAIGIAAVNQTNHSLNQRQVMYIDRSRMKNLPLTDRQWLGDGLIKFERYNRLNINGKAVPVLSMIKDATADPNKANDISDILGQFIDGYVDIAKGPWIMELGATPNVASTWLFLVKLGVPINSVAFFMNQPIIRDYLRSVENAGYTWLFIDDIVDEMKAKYASSAQKPTTIPSAGELYETIGKKNLSSNEKAAQIFMLDEFLKYAKMGQQMFNLTQGSNFDTATFNDPFLVFKKGKQLEVAQRGLISSVDDLLDNSFIGDLYSTIIEIRDALAQILPSDQENVRRVLEKVLLDQLDNSDRDFVKIAQKAKNDLFDWAVQTNRGINSNLLNTLVNGNEVVDQNGNTVLTTSAPRKVLDFVEEVKADPTHPLHNNHVINLIDVRLSEVDGGVDNVAIKNKDNKIYDQNNVIYAFKEMREYTKNMDDDIYKQLLRLAIVQSGLSNSPISYTSLIPYDDFQQIYNKTLSNINNLENLEDFYNLKVFARNNWSDDDIVPRRQAKWTTNSYGDRIYNTNMNFSVKVNTAMVQGKLPKLLKLSTKARESVKDTIVYTWENLRISKEQRKEMRERGDYSYINKGLFTKVKDKTGNPLTITRTINGQPVVQFVYKMINAWGDGYKANEFYAGARPSVFAENGFMKVQYSEEETPNGIVRTSNEVADEVIIPYFVTPKTETKTEGQDVIAEEVTIPEEITDEAEDTEDKVSEDVIIPSKEVKLDDGKRYKVEDITFQLLTSIGYKPKRANELLKTLCLI